MTRRRRIPVRVRRVPSAYETMRDAAYGRPPVQAVRRRATPADVEAPAGAGGPAGVGVPVEAEASRARAGARAEAAETVAAKAAKAAIMARAGQAAATNMPGLGEAREPQAGDLERESSESLAEWRDRALRLQAEIENFRKRQQRLTEERIRDDRERLLRAFLSVSDDLERALSADGVDSARLREGVDLTHQGLMHLLEREGAETIEALGQPFDPALHEGVATVPHEQAGFEPNTVARVLQAGYRIGDRLLRPARVIVAA